MILMIFHVCNIIYAIVFVFFFNDTATTEIYTLSLHDALPIWRPLNDLLSGNFDNQVLDLTKKVQVADAAKSRERDRKSTRLNSSH